MFKELEETYKGLVNFRNYEVLCQIPRISYIECDYTGEYDDGIRKLYGHTIQLKNEELNIFNANLTNRVKQMFKECCIRKVTEEEILKRGVAV